MIPSNAVMAKTSIQIGVDFANASTGEDNNDNHGFQIDRVEQVWGLDGVSYCAMGQFWDFAKAYAELTGISFEEDSAVGIFRGLKNIIASQYLEFSPSVQDMVDSAQSKHIWRPMSHGADNIMFGEYLCYDWSRGIGIPEHHIEQVINVSDDLQFAQTLGWNTSGGGGLDESTNNPRFGGVHVKRRSLVDGTVMGWIAWRRGT